ncbi:hypothetical protein TVAG_376890 [Trichomonas vaginalis G3]|uniref:Uncharacterized protein n=1 Tax=Trichomonas vaginalis (strain ATCC PRA-98 / G3) TaxID=412133 RepID=A2GJM2_TRIV3|nr:hypothetical protein TVAGG3_0111710 [Trichomonas vaginalis G3]EAX82645.1 hypothetical protein TVAG_376890 [Trichomonas vaginalis G3]KAI5544972.1 hypothetical protein TVAGG3_0111710 [Trichomonas vaginalis G3]|eukprot:XP_001295575.1 hypothetical protein [Trichomonas vaginalis G3]
MDLKSCIPTKLPFHHKMLEPSDYEMLIKESKDVEQDCLAPSTRKTYARMIFRYANILRTIDGTPNPFPITEDNARAFIEYYRLTHETTIKYIKLFIASFVFWCNEKETYNFTKSQSFKKYKKRSN